MPIACEYDMGSFGPNAYSDEHLHVEVGRQMLTHSQLQTMNRRQAAADYKWVLIDAYSGGCGATVSAIQAGVFVKTAFEAAREEILAFKDLTGQINLGAINQVKFERSRIPQCHLWWSSSCCKDYCPLGSRKGEAGAKGGDHFVEQSKYAEASGVLALLWESVDGVATLNKGAALTKLQANCRRDKFMSFWSEKVNFFDHRDP